MKYSLLLLSACAVLMTSACAGEPATDQKRGWFFGMFPPKQWPERHWEGQDFQTQVAADEYALPEALDLNRSMFDSKDIENLSPDDFIKHLMAADIIETTENEKTWMFGKPTGNVIVETDYNFYTLAQADKVVIADLLSQSYDHKFIILKDAHTNRDIGNITSEGLVLF